MRNERKKLLAKLAYLYYIEEKSQAEIAAETGIYRTTVSRMLAEESTAELEERLGQSAANLLRALLDDHMNVGFSWGKSLSLLVEHLNPRHLKDIHFVPLAGGPSHIHTRYHVNTLIYNMASKCHGDCNFINATIIQEKENLAKGILSSKYFEDLKKSWQDLDIAVVGIGGFADENNRQWLDMLTERDFSVLKSEGEVGEICCRFFDKNGKPVYEELQERTIAISLSELKKIPNTLGFAYGYTKATAILSVLRAGYINHLVTDEETILKVLSLDGDGSFI